MDAGELDLEDLPPKALRKLIKSMMAKAGKPRDEKESDEADEEREALADLHASHKGKPSPVEVTKDDLPPELQQDDEEVDEPSELEAEDEEATAKPTKKKKGK